jgi:hypothetical protein
MLIMDGALLGRLLRAVGLAGGMLGRKFMHDFVVQATASEPLTCVFQRVQWIYRRQLADTARYDGIVKFDMKGTGMFKCHGAGDGKWQRLLYIANLTEK